MLDTHRDTDFLEDLWMDDCKCESAHEVKGFTNCSVKVVGRKTTACTGRDFLICAKSYAYNMGSILSRRYLCSDCGDLTSECWTIRPI